MKPDEQNADVTSSPLTCHTELFAKFVAAGNAYKVLAGEIKYADGDRAWIKLDELKQTWMDSAWRLHDALRATTRICDIGNNE